MKNKANIGMLSNKSADDGVREWDLVNPEGIAQIKPMKVGAHLFSTLEGKTVMLRWNGKHNGDHFLNRIYELLAEKVKNVNIIKSWEVAPETATSSVGMKKSRMFFTNLALYRPDIVIGAQCD